MHYRKLGQISPETRDRLLSSLPEMHNKKDETTDYWSAGNIKVTDIDESELTEIWDKNRWLRGMVVALKPGGFLHPHVHNGDRDLTKNHVVLKTNDKCESWNGGICHKLEELGVYEMESCLEHESFNHGDTDRIHLIIEVLNDADSTSPHS